jgi:hypothetical protein
MKLWKRRAFLAAAYEWKAERVGQIQAEVRILEALLETTRQELYDTRQLHGEKLALMYGSLSESDLAGTMRERDNFERECEDIFLAGEHNLKSKGQAA